MTFQIPKVLLDGIIARLNPAEVYLFGSLARGDAQGDSDIDLYVLLDDRQAQGLDSSRAIGEARSGYPGPVDIVLSTMGRHARYRGRVGTMAHVVDQEGALIYVRAA